MPVNEIDTIASRLALGDAVLAAVKESGLLRKPRTSTARYRKAIATRARNKRLAAKAASAVAPAPKATKSGSKPKNPLKNVPDEHAA